MVIPFLSLKALNEVYAEELKTAFDNFLAGGTYMLANNVKRFESEFAAYCSAKHSIGVANGLDALELILQSVGLHPGAEVIVPANTYFASILSICNAGFTPVFVEPDPITYLLDPQRVEDAISPRTGAILAVNLYGKMCDYESLRTVAQKHQLRLLTDAAQSHGALYQGSTACPYTDAVAYSFYPTKNLGALADAGAVVTDDDEVARLVRAKRNYGSEIRYQFDYLGKNSRLSELQAAFLSVKLKHLPKETERRRSIAQTYLREVKNDRIILPPSDTAEADAWHLFVVRSHHRAELKQHLERNGIGYDVHYPVPPHQQKAFAQFAHLSLPITEEIHRTVLSIPLNPMLSDREVETIVATLNTF